MYSSCLVLLRYLLLDVGRLTSSPAADGTIPSDPLANVALFNSAEVPQRLCSFNSVTQLSPSLSELDILRYLQAKAILPPAAQCDLTVATVFNSYVRYFLMDGRCILSLIEWQHGSGAPVTGGQTAVTTDCIMIVR